ncbi:thiamine-phosphate kinase, partial [Candidatus Aerophobetes bacterium]
MKLKEIGEFGLIRRMRSSLKDSQRNAVLGIGDDGAALKIAPGKLTLVTLDALVENTHFKWDYASPRQVGWKALAVNISDIAAMGGMPTYCV